MGGLTAYALGVWLVAGAIAWAVGVAVLVAFFLSKDARRRGGGCRGCRPEAGRQGCKKRRADGPARCDFGPGAARQGLVDINNGSER